MKVYLISDTHFNHANIATYCDRPKDFTERIIKQWQITVKPEDLIIHLGDVAIGPRNLVVDILKQLPGRKILVLGNHDRQNSPTWWMQHGFDFACQGLVFRNCWLTHEPATSRVGGCDLNIHGHLHNIWHGFHPDGENSNSPSYSPTSLRYPWQRLFALEYTEYRPVEFDKFVQHPEKYQATGLRRG